VREGCTVAIIETTSEGYLQHRHRFINYDTIVLTNLYPEHIEAHGGFENYKAAKKGIFRHVAESERKRLNGKRVPKTAIVNGAFEWAEEFLSFGFDKKIRFTAADAVPAALPGAHTPWNVAAAAVVARELGVGKEVAWNAGRQLRSVPGRIEEIPEAALFRFRVIVDYAFEPVAMAALYDVADGIEHARIIHVFGATGGGRDISRRAVLGAYIASQADICIITNEDPYDDDPLAIMEDIAKAVRGAGKKEGENVFLIEDRRAAIQKAIFEARPGDLVLVTGKGSEQGMVVKGKILPWDDCQIVRDALKKIVSRK
jgi:UDP-N-acetylmuramoyl-L-alanyl-D-glutamate--2,6-diaminopimelate ligase